MKTASGTQGILLVDKQPGITSFDALSSIKRSLQTRRVGHCGTLDKFAEGLLIVLVGRSTRLVPWFTALDKRYIARICFGIETSSLDPEGEEIARGPIPNEKDVFEILPAFSGQIMQRPPAYSAIHIDGKRAWQLAREGREVLIKERPVHIHAIELLDWQSPYAIISVHCSSGTYIRSLARDIGLALGTRAYVQALARESIADFARKDATVCSGPEEKNDEADSPAAGKANSGTEMAEKTRAALKPVSREHFKAIGIQTAEVSGPEILHIRQGRALPGRIVDLHVENAQDLALVDEEGVFVAMLKKKGPSLAYACVDAGPT